MKVFKQNRIGIKKKYFVDFEGKSKNVSKESKTQIIPDFIFGRTNPWDKLQKGRLLRLNHSSFDDETSRKFRKSRDFKLSDF